MARESALEASQATSCWSVPKWFVQPTWRDGVPHHLRLQTERRRRRRLERIEDLADSERVVRKRQAHERRQDSLVVREVALHGETPRWPRAHSCGDLVIVVIVVIIDSL